MGTHNLYTTHAWAPHKTYITIYYYGYTLTGPCTLIHTTLRIRKMYTHLTCTPTSLRPPLEDTRVIFSKLTAMVS